MLVLAYVNELMLQSSLGQFGSLITGFVSLDNFFDFENACLGFKGKQSS